MYISTHDEVVGGFSMTAPGVALNQRYDRAYIYYIILYYIKLYILYYVLFYSIILYYMFLILYKRSIDICSIYMLQC